MNKKISRQHSETEIAEIVGKICKSILAVGGAAPNSILIFYVALNDVWLRMFLDTGVLFVDTCDGPDREDDLEEGAEYLDLAMMHGLKGKEISSASMKNGIFRLGFKCGTELLVEQHGEESKLRVVK